MANRVILGKRGGANDFGLYISRDGVNVADSTSTTPLSFNADAANSLIVHSCTALNLIISIKIILATINSRTRKNCSRTTIGCSPLSPSTTKTNQSPRKQSRAFS